MMILDEEDAELILSTIFEGMKKEDDKNSYLKRHDNIIKRILNSYPDLKENVKRNLNHDLS